MYTAGDLRHEFTPTFSWLVLVVLVGVLVLGFFIAMSQVDYRRTIETITIDKTKKPTTKKALCFFTASTASRVIYAVFAFIACELVVLKEHGDGILQWELNHAGAAASEGIVLFATIVLIGIFTFAYSCLAFAVFGFGTKVKLFFVDLFVIREEGIEFSVQSEERPSLVGAIIRKRKRRALAAKKKAVAKQSSVPARKTTRVATRHSAV